MRDGLLPSQHLPRIARGTFAAVELGRGNRVGFAAPIAIDLGGIAKGFAVDRAIATLRSRGVRDAIVNAGGDMRVMGETPHPVYIRCSGSDGRAARVGQLRNAAVATSSASAIIRRNRSDCEQSADPAVADGNVYSVVASTCWLADALTKVLVQLALVDACETFARFGATAFMTCADGSLLKAA
jgi:thiamine biosynthesis lipoprotein